MPMMSSLATCGSELVQWRLGGASWPSVWAACSCRCSVALLSIPRLFVDAAGFVRGQGTLDLTAHQRSQVLGCWIRLEAFCVVVPEHFKEHFAADDRQADGTHGCEDGAPGAALRRLQVGYAGVVHRSGRSKDCRRTLAPSHRTGKPVCSYLSTMTILVIVVPLYSLGRR